MICLRMTRNLPSGRLNDNNVFLVANHYYYYYMGKAIITKKKKKKASPGLPRSYSQTSYTRYFVPARRTFLVLLKIEKLTVKT